MFTDPSGMTRTNYFVNRNGRTHSWTLLHLERGGPPRPEAQGPWHRDWRLLGGPGGDCAVFAGCIFGMLGIQWVLSVRNGISLDILLLYLVHPCISVGVFCYRYHRRREGPSAGR